MVATWVIYQITGSQWSDYYRDADYNAELMQRNANNWMIMGGIAGAAIGGGAGVVVGLISGQPVLSIIFGVVVGVGSATAGALIGLVAGGQAYVDEMKDTLYWMDNTLGDLDPNSDNQVTIFHNAGAPAGHPASQGYSICINGQCIEVSDKVGRELRTVFNQTEADIKRKEQSQ